jgi:predicted Zn-ribbon and HTH transcriptional regulator
MPNIQRCPNCNSTRLFNEVSIVARKNVNTGRVYNIDKSNEDDFFEPTYCEKCGWSDESKVAFKKQK